jgi:chromosome segregation ATPase
VPDWRCRCVEQIPAAELIAILTDERTYSGENRDGINDGVHVVRRPIQEEATQMATKRSLSSSTAFRSRSVTTQAKAAIEKLQGQVKVADERAAKAEGDIAKLTTDKATLEAKVTTLEQQVKDAKLTPQQLRDAAKAFAQTLDTAKKLAPAATLNDSMDEAAIKRAVVSAKLGDAAKDWSDEQIAVSFDTLASLSAQRHRPGSQRPVGRRAGQRRRREGRIREGPRRGPQEPVGRLAARRRTPLKE